MGVLCLYWSTLVLCAVVVTRSLAQDIPCPANEDICSCRFRDGDFGDVIDCSGQELSEVPTFNISDHMWDTLLLSDNTIGEIGSEAFNGLLLKAIIADNAGIVTLADNAFNGLEDVLEKIDFTDNVLNENTIMVINDLQMLSILTLDYNQITKLNESHFRNLPRLSELHLQFNLFTEVLPSYVANVPTLVNYDLYGNYISYVDEASFQDLPQLTILDLGINSLPDVPTNAFQNLTLLQSLSLWANDFTELSEDSLSTVSPTLELLWLGFNDVSSLPENLLSGFPLLRNLFISDMLLEDIPDNLFQNKPRLDYVDMATNLFSGIPRGIGALTNLGTLFFQENLVTTINGDEFANNPGLYRLYLSENQISFVNQSLFCTNTELYEVFLENNAIVEFDACGTLALKQCYVFLAGNPLYCGCDILWLKQQGRIRDPQLATCDSPENLAGRVISDIEDSEFQCDLNPDDVCLDVCQ